jgi:Bacterial flagellin C-terminal helical region
VEWDLNYDIDAAVSGPAIGGGVGSDGMTFGVTRSRKTPRLEGIAQARRARNMSPRSSWGRTRSSRQEIPAMAPAANVAAVTSIGNDCGFDQVFARQMEAFCATGRRPSGYLRQRKFAERENALVGADPATAATDLAQAQIANQATISATSRLLSLPTLLDFLK